MTTRSAHELLLPTDELLEPFSVDVDGHAVAAHAFGRDGRLRPYPPLDVPVPWTYFTFLRQQLVRGRTVHELMSRDPRRGLLGGVTYRGSERARIGDRVRARSRIVDQTVHERDASTLVVTLLQTDWEGPGSWELTETTTLIDVFGESDGPPARDPSTSGADDRHLVTPTPVQIAWYCTATDDLQEVHHDPDVARARGHAERLVPGSLVLACLEELHRRAGRELTELSCRFLSPMYPHEELRVRTTAQDAGRERFEVATARGLAAKGAVEWRT